MSQQTVFSFTALARARFLICFIGVLSVFDASARLNNNNIFFIKFQHKYNTETTTRIKQWQKLIQTASHLTEREKLLLVNNFFNQHINFVSDKSLWGVNDYWATPQEVLIKGAGDCEDFSIIKYFTLIQLGIPEDKIRLTYTRALNHNQPHMVLSYSPTPLATPIILDNLIPEIKSAKERKDLLPVFSFNDSDLWIEKSKGSIKLAGNSSQIAMWDKLRKRMDKNI